MHNAKAILTTRRAGGLFVLQSSVFRINEKLHNGKQGHALTKQRKLPLRRFPAEWNKYGKMAGPMRNAQMMSYAKEGIPALVAFWDGKSRGTKNMINTADNGRTFVRVIRYDS